MPITLVKPESWHAERLRGLGGSDAGTIMNVGFDTPYRLWQLKTKRREPDDLMSIKRVRWGTILEDRIAAVIRHDHPDWNVRRRNATQWSKAYPWAFAHLDRVATIDDVTVPVEIKTSGYEGEWGADGSSDIPHYYVPQIQHELAVTDAPYAIVVALIGGHDDRYYYVPRHPAYIAHLMETEQAFWQHVIDDTPPPPSTERDVLDRYATVTGSIEAAPELVATLDQYQALQNNIKQLESQSQPLRDAIAVAIGEAETVTSNGTPIATYKRQSQERLDTTLVKTNYPDAAAACLKTTTFRRLHFVKRGPRA
ncbi:MAG: YqaJ viral recombinase family nuclease [Vulcanimicrobiaceae bacterium]